MGQFGTIVTILTVILFLFLLITSKKHLILIVYTLFFKWYFLQCPILVYNISSYLTIPPLSVSSALPVQHPSLPNPFSPNLGYICGPVRSTQLEDDSDTDEPEAPPIGLRRARLQSTPSSCYSEWDSSLWNTWSSVMDGNMASARTSLISSVDSCYTNDSTNFARLLAVAAETMSAASLSGKQRGTLYITDWFSLKKYNRVTLEWKTREISSAFLRGFLFVFYQYVFKESSLLSFSGTPHSHSHS